MRVSEHLRSLIQSAGGQVGFDHWMREVLYAPGLGYYSAGAAKFGAAGDFTTAPEVSAVFARCLARQCRELMPEVGAHIVEVGPGSGALARDLLAELNALGCAPDSYRLLEVSADLRQRQQSALSDFTESGATRIEWLDEPPQESWRGVLLANEVLDALPVRCFEITAGKGEPRIQERAVQCVADGFGWLRVPADDRLQSAVLAIESALGTALPAGYCSEVSTGLDAWLATLTGAMKKGVALLCDYGLPRASYYLPERSRGTLICHYRHRAHDDPFLYPGLQDISAWVDFTAVAEAAQAAGCSVAGFSTQAHFLIGAGLEAVLADSNPSAGVDQLRLASEVKTLTMPGEMGERFKFMALGRDIDLALSGFGFRDMRDKL